MSEFLKIPYVGKATEASLKLIGYDTLESLQDADPELMYEKECSNVSRRTNSCSLNFLSTILSS